MFTYRDQNRIQPRLGFTILEVLIALTASLLMMLALTRAFKLIGDKITQSQSELELSSTLRNATFSLRDELARLTPDMVAPQPRDASSGYFTYYEGPWSDATTMLINNTGPQTGYLPTSRYGDLDDYLAFTARAQPGAPFVGMIPRGVLEAHRFEQHIAAGNAANTFITFDGDPIGSYTANDAFALVPFYSDYAEIAYFCSPRWVRDSLGQPIYDGSGNPQFEDVVNEVGGATPGDNIPDRLTLHRRILLIRPDLNMTPRRMFSISGPALVPAVPNTDEEIEQLPILVPPGGGSPAVVRPLASQDLRFQPGPWSSIVWPVGVSDAVRPPWLTGVARVQQMMDLSVAHITNDWETANGATAYGMPAASSPSTGGPANLAANSLLSLSRPENRFAHVRMPGFVFNGVANLSSMPMLALAPPHPYLSVQEQNTVATAPTTDDRFGQGIGGSPVSYGNFTMAGFLRPEFALADYTVANRAAPGTTAVPTYRGGSDIVAADALGFDVQVFDENAPNFVWMGVAPDNVPGNPGNDDGDGATDELDELGYPNSDDALISVNSPAVNPLVGTAPPVFGSTAIALPAGANQYLVSAPGEFVDFGFVRQAGGSVGGMNVIDRLGVAPRRVFHDLFSTNYSGLSFITDAAGVTYSRYPVAWSQSGRFVFGTTPSVNSFVQPTIDTWTESYDGDGFEQDLITFNFDATGSTLVPDPITAPGPVPVQTRYWNNTAESAVAGPGFVDGSSAGSQSRPPTPVMPRAVKISIRVYDRTAGEIRQQTVIHEFDR